MRRLVYLQTNDHVVFSFLSFWANVDMDTNLAGYQELIEKVSFTTVSAGVVSAEVVRHSTFCSQIIAARPMLTLSSKLFCLTISVVLKVFHSTSFPTALVEPMLLLT